MVPGLYDSIDPTVVPQGWKFVDHHFGQEFQTDIVAPNGATESVSRSCDPASKKWTLESAFFDPLLPTWIGEGVPVVENRGSPLLAYLDMRLMKLAKIGAGSLRSNKMSTIQNIETICQLEGLIAGGLSPHEAVAQTHSIAYASNEIIQLGHTIAKIELIGGQRSITDDLLRHYEAPNMIGQSSYRTPAQHDAILARYGVSRTSEVLWNFDIVFHLTPQRSP